MRILSHLTTSNGKTVQLSQKTFLTFLLILFAVSLAASVDAQGQDATIDFLDVEFWPDYDKTAVLVLMTGSVTAETNLPVSVTIPIPENAEINAVARVDSARNLFTDINFDTSEPGNLLLNLEEPSFRIEYYFPYESNGSQRAFSFEWLADLDVNQMRVTFQQPSLATNVVLSPEANNTITGEDNLLYHQLPNQIVVAGTTYSVDASYEMVRQQLSSELITSQEAANVPAITPAIDSQDPGDFNWILALGVVAGALLLAAIGWFIYTEPRSSRRVIKPRPIRREQFRRSPTPGSRSTRPIGTSRFCHECGQPLDPGDKFCRNCGTLVKSK